MSSTIASPDIGRRARRRWPRGVAVVIALVLLVAASVSASTLLPDVAARDRDAWLSPARAVDPPRYLGSFYGLNAPLGVAPGPDGTLYVTEAEGERFLRALDPAGGPPLSFPGLAMPTSVAVAPSGDIFVTDRAAPGVYVFSPAGELIRELTPPVPASEWNPVALAFDDAGRLYVVDLTPGKHRVLFLDADFRLVRAWGSEGTGPGQLYYPGALAIDGEGRLWLSDSNNGRVLRFDRDGNVYSVIARGRTPGDVSLPRGLAIDTARSVLYVADATNGVVNAYDIAGPAPRFLFVLDDAVRGTPGALVIDRGGRLYVADRAGGRLDVWLTN